MDDELENMLQGSEPAQSFVEKRREERYAVPDVYKQYIKMEVKNGDQFVPAVLGNFSRSGILFESPARFEKGDKAECKISISLLLSREISFGITVMYCYTDKDSHISGATIDTIADDTWFDVFVEVHDFISQRQRSVS